MESLKIEYHEGCLELNLNIFPCTNEKANIIFQLVTQWCSEETIEGLKNHFIQQMDIDGAAREYSRIKQSVLDNERCVKAQKHPNGVPMSFEEILHTKSQIVVDKKKLKSIEDLVKKRKAYERMLKLLSKHIEKR